METCRIYGRRMLLDEPPTTPPTYHPRPIGAFPRLRHPALGATLACDDHMILR